MLFLCFRSLVTLAIRGHAHTLVLNSPLQGTFVVGRSRLPSSAILRWVPTEVAVQARAVARHGSTHAFVDVQMVDLCQIHATSSSGRAGRPQTTVSARTVIGSILLLLRPSPRPPRLPQPRLLPNTSNWRARTDWTACTGPFWNRAHLEGHVFVAWRGAGCPFELPSGQIRGAEGCTS